MRVWLLCATTLAIGCGSEPPAEPGGATPPMLTVTRAPFGIITSLKTPDRNGASADIVLGFDTLYGYLGYHPYFGAVLGRYANRIALARFTIDGIAHRLAMNSGPGVAAKRRTTSPSASMPSAKPW